MKPEPVIVTVLCALELALHKDAGTKLVTTKGTEVVVKLVSSVTPHGAEPIAFFGVTYQKYCVNSSKVCAEVKV